MMLEIFKAKIHQARITQADLFYEGSLTVDEDLLEAAGILPYEKVQVVNISNGNRFETYAIKGERGSGVIGLNGAAARLGVPGDMVIVITYAQMSPEEAAGFKPTVILVDEKNKIVKKL